jgi:hypothetical protein
LLLFCGGRVCAQLFDERVTPKNKWIFFHFACPLVGSFAALATFV